MTQLRIGDLARLGGVSVRTLRHHHEIGLLEPAAIDRSSGYRLYRSEQLETLRERRSKLPILGGERFVFGEVIYEIAHRFGDELLLRDCWGRIGEPGQHGSEVDAAWLDPIAELLVTADQGDVEAERHPLDRYRDDDGLHPGPTVLQASPYGHPPKEINLARS